MVKQQLHHHGPGFLVFEGEVASLSSDQWLKRYQSKTATTPLSPSQPQPTTAAFEKHANPTAEQKVMHISKKKAIPKSKSKRQAKARVNSKPNKSVPTRIKQSPPIPLRRPSARVRVATNFFIPGISTQIHDDVPFVYTQANEPVYQPQEDALSEKEAQPVHEGSVAKPIGTEAEGNVITFADDKAKSHEEQSFSVEKNAVCIAQRDAESVSEPIRQVKAGGTETAETTRTNHNENSISEPMTKAATQRMLNASVSIESSVAKPAAQDETDSVDKSAENLVGNTESLQVGCAENRENIVASPPNISAVAPAQEASVTIALQQVQKKPVKQRKKRRIRVIPAALRPKPAPIITQQDLPSESIVPLASRNQIMQLNRNTDDGCKKVVDDSSDLPDIHNDNVDAPHAHKKRRRHLDTTASSPSVLAALPFPEPNKVDTSIIKVSPVVQQKPKRGRLPKKSSVATSSEANRQSLNESTSGKRKRGRPPKSKDDAIAEPKRKRGRPRKVENTESNDDAVAQPKRKPGRPRKVQNTESKDNAIAQPKRKPGRPRKVQNTESKDDAMTQPKRKPGRPRKVQNAENKDDAMAQPKRKPGRPRKVQNTQSKDDAMAQPKRKPGRPRKVQNTESKDDAMAQPKRKPGRPRKVQNTESKDDAIAQPKRKPGRPRKVQDTESKDDAIAQPKRKRGRPRKVQDTEGKDDAIPQPKRKRGRPRKVQDTEGKDDAIAQPKCKQERPRKVQNAEQQKNHPTTQLTEKQHMDNQVHKHEINEICTVSAEQTLEAVESPTSKKSAQYQSILGKESPMHLNWAGAAQDAKPTLGAQQNAQIVHYLETRPKRGRPPKSKANETEQLWTEKKTAGTAGSSEEDASRRPDGAVDVDPKPKRGRPPKNKNIVPKKSGPVQGSSGSTGKPQEEWAQNAVSKPKRVRPRKKANADLETETTVDHVHTEGAVTKVIPKLRRGRPPKQKSTEGFALKAATGQRCEPDEKLTQVSKPMRGRPRKEANAGLETETIVDDVHMEGAVTKVTPNPRRGWPPKQKFTDGIALQASTGQRCEPDEKLTQKTASKQKMGAPRKKLNADIDSNEVGDEEKTQQKETADNLIPIRKRGCPPKDKNIAPTEGVSLWDAAGRTFKSVTKCAETAQSTACKPKIGRPSKKGGADAAISSQLKPRRGRPPKNKSAPLNEGPPLQEAMDSTCPKPEEKGSQSSGVKRKRGRPRKVANSVGTASMPHDCTFEEDRTQTDGAIVSLQPNPRRGRPPKNKNAAPGTQGTKTTVDLNSKPRRGRPPKNKDTALKDDYSLQDATRRPSCTLVEKDSQSTGSKPKRGRPRKKVNVIAQVKPVGDDCIPVYEIAQREEFAVNLKPKRGRPPKSKEVTPQIIAPAQEDTERSSDPAETEMGGVCESNEKSANSTAAVEGCDMKKKRGWPPKNKNMRQTSDVSGQEVGGRMSKPGEGGAQNRKQKMGRPRKSVTSSDENKTNSEVTQSTESLEEFPKPRRGRPPKKSVPVQNSTSKAATRDDSKGYGKKKPRWKPCGNCLTCRFDSNCGSCNRCLKMHEFGGKETGKLRCLNRICLTPIPPEDWVPDMPAAAADTSSIDGSEEDSAPFNRSSGVIGLSEHRSSAHTVLPRDSDVDSLVDSGVFDDMSDVEAEDDDARYWENRQEERRLLLSRNVNKIPTTFTIAHASNTTVVAPCSSPERSSCAVGERSAVPSICSSDAVGGSFPPTTDDNEEPSRDDTCKQVGSPLRETGAQIARRLHQQERMRLAELASDAYSSSSESSYDDLNDVPPPPVDYIM